MPPFTALEQDYLLQQLGKAPDGAMAIAAYSSQGIPLVLQMRSWHKQPFPTLYWLCSKDLYKAIARLETWGLVKQLEQRLQQDSVLMQHYQADQQAYVQRRWELMLAEDRQVLDQKGLISLFDRYGIGGLGDWQQIRCLHMQYAQHLAMGNSIGQILDDEYGLGQVIVTL